MSETSKFETSSTHISRREALSGLFVGTLATGLSLAGQTVRADDRIAANTKKGDSSTPLTPALAQARATLDALKKVKDYTATFFKDELVGKTRVIQQMSLKFRESPFSVYLRFQKDLDGREVIFVDGKNDGKLLVHGSGIESIVGTLKLAPDHKKIMEENRYPFTMIGMSNLMKTLVGQWERELPQTDLAVKMFPNAKLGNVECKVFESTRAKKTADGQFHVTRLYTDKATQMPVRVEQLDFPTKAGDQPQVLEQYTYIDLKTNVGLTDMDFDTKNKSYKF